MQDAARKILRQFWGYDDFRPFQYEIIQSVLSGRDTLALLPTGGGKSLTFQVPALMMEGLTLVVSPLIALMNDQVAQLKKRGVKSDCLHSGLHRREIERLLDNAAFGDTKLLYISPERLQSKDFLMRMPQLPVSLLVVDEAHCISMWGYDFRPAYLSIAEVRSELKKCPCIALTASATAEVQTDIVKRLQLKDPVVVQGQFTRPNLKFGVLHTEDKSQRAFKLLHQEKGSAIVYARTRRMCRELAGFFAKKGLSATYYHAGLDRVERVRRENAFLQRDVRVMVATNAFGMGIDKSDVRMVIHHDLPDNLESYYQEAGRAGRDGQEAYALQLFHPSDVLRLENQYEQSFPDLAAIRRIYRGLGNYFKLAIGGGLGVTYRFELEEFVKAFDLSAVTVYNSLKILEQSGWIHLAESVFEPSKVQFLVEKDTLYDYQLRNKARDPIIRALLRLYQGILADLVPVRESQLASFLHIDITKVKASLKEMHADGVLEYIEQSDSGQLTMLRERVSHENLLIDTELLSFRKERYRKGIDALISYVHGGVCRQRFILEYFDVPVQDDCGVCDYCAMQNRIRKIEGESIELITEKVLKTLTSDPQRISGITRQLDEYPQSLIHQILQLLLMEEKVIKTDDQIQLAQ